MKIVRMPPRNTDVGSPDVKVRRSSRGLERRLEGVGGVLNFAWNALQYGVASLNARRGLGNRRGGTDIIEAAFATFDDAILVYSNKSEFHSSSGEVIEAQA